VIAAVPPSVAELREEFLLDPDVVFLNHGSFGACPRPVFEQYQAWQRELERQPVEFLGRRIEALLAEARAGLASYVGAEADDLVFVPNATSGVNLAARALALEPGDEVLSTDLEYGACDLAWEHVCARAGARYVRAHVPLPVTSSAAIVDALFARLTERTRVVYVSHVTSMTALRLPVEEICSRARELGLVAIVDGAHAPAQVPLDLGSLDAAFYSGNCHKWLCAPKGAGFLWVRPELQESVHGLIVSWGYDDDGGGTFLSRNEKQGTRDPAAYLTVPTAIAWQEERAWDQVRERCHALVLEARAVLAELTGLEPLTPPTREFLGQMVTTKLPPCDREELKRRLYDEHRVEVPVWDTDDGQFLRVSVQAYNDERDLDALAAALRALL
jgi:isopenicillin-N epimerase